MNNSTELLRNGAVFFRDELYWEAADCFKKIIDSGENESILDDAYLNLAICYMKLNLFHEAAEFFLPVYRKEVGDGVFQNDSNNYGETSARAALGLVRISLALDDIKQAQMLIDELETTQAGFIKDEVRTSYFEVAKSELEYFSRSLAS